jgi:hypothetical protein
MCNGPRSEFAKLVDECVCYGKAVVLSFNDYVIAWLDAEG